jgi:DNA modification methylase
MITKTQNGDVIEGDCLSILPSLPENQFHAIVTDPPYNFEDGFMGQEWDDIGNPKEYQNWCQEWGKLALSTLKPGGHMLAITGNRSDDQLMVGI